MQAPIAQSPPPPYLQVIKRSSRPQEQRRAARLIELIRQPHWLLVGGCCIIRGGTGGVGQRAHWFRAGGWVLFRETPPALSLCSASSLQVTLLLLNAFATESIPIVLNKVLNSRPATIVISTGKWGHPHLFC